MSGRFKPEIIVVRRQLEDGRWREATERDRPFNHPDFAVVVRGVPMVGERVAYRKDDRGTVVGHEVHPVVRWDDLPEEDEVLAEDCRPAPDEDKALVERVARAMFEADHPDGGWDASGWDGRIDRETYLARAEVAIKTMEKKP